MHVEKPKHVQIHCTRGEIDTTAHTMKKSANLPWTLTGLHWSTLENLYVHIIIVQRPSSLLKWCCKNEQRTCISPEASDARGITGHRTHTTETSHTLSPTASPCSQLFTYTTKDSQKPTCSIIHQGHFRCEIPSNPLNFLTHTECKTKINFWWQVVQRPHCAGVRVWYWQLMYTHD